MGSQTKERLCFMKRKINVIGRICRVIATILMVLACIGTGALLVTGVVLVALPQDSVVVDVTGTAKVEAYGTWIDAIPNDTVRDYNSAIEDGGSTLIVEGSRADNVEKNGDTITVTGTAAEKHFTLRRLGLSLLAAAVGVSALIYVFLMLAKLMKELAVCESPFTEGVVKRMTGFAISLIPYAVIKPMATSIATSCFAANDIQIGLNLDLGTLFTALIIFLLITIFKYGVSLQKESDELL